MRLLALDAALGGCSAALIEDGVCLCVDRLGDGRGAVAQLPAMVQAMLQRRGRALGAVAATVGPGSFTGLRAALALAHGIALGAGVPVIGVTVAEALLHATPAPPGRVAWVALDSRRSGRLYLGRDGRMEPAALDALPRPDRPVFVYGDMADQVVAVLQAAGADALSAEAAQVNPIAVGQVAWLRYDRVLPPCEAQPLYVAPPEARLAAGLRPAPA